jgi:hypothetical protein
VFIFPNYISNIVLLTIKLKETLKQWSFPVTPQVVTSGRLKNVYKIKNNKFSP